MNIICGKDIIDIFKVSYVTIRKINEHELGNLEEEYHGHFSGYGLSNEKYLEWLNLQILFKTNVISEAEFKEREKGIFDVPRRKKREEFLSKYADKSILVISMNSKSKQYLEDYCGFDIFSKKQEIEKAIVLTQEKRRAQIKATELAQEEKRRAQIKATELAQEKRIAQIKATELAQEKRIAQIKADKITFAATVTSAFYEQNLLSVSPLTNKEKLKEYSDIRDFCCKYVPDLSERGFRVESIPENYPDYVSEEVCAIFKENWNRINRSYSVLSRGANGEEKVYEVLRLFDDRIRILRDYVWGHEHDFIVITPYGISTIEVKNLRGNYVLTETGILKCLSSKRVKPKDIALQSKKHLETLRRNLSGCSAFSANVPLQEIICSAEPNFTIKDDYHYIPVCYYNTVDKVLLPDNGKPILDVKAMDAIEKYLLENKQEAFKFDVFLPRGEIDGRDEFIKNFSDVASGFMVSQNKAYRR